MVSCIRRVSASLFSARSLILWLLLGVLGLTAAIWMSPASALAADTCTSCHSTQAHPTGWDCVRCHPYGNQPLNRHPDEYDEHSPEHTSADCVSCHDPEWREHYAEPHVPGTTRVDGVTFSGESYSCSDCHNSSRPDVPTHPAHTGALPEPSCADCHEDDVSLGHVDCGTCHDSLDAKVVAAIASRNLSCAACHDVAGGHADLHVGGTVGTECASCHDDNISTVHAEACSRCHDSARVDVVAAIASGDRSCAACHEVRDVHAELHGIGSNECTQCHRGDNISSQHGGDCSLCHESTSVRVVSAIAASDVSCTSCHSPHGTGSRSSAYLGTDTSAASKSVSAGGAKAAYVTWAKATLDASNALVASNLRLSPHGDYATTTIKCQVCHSAHKAVNSGSALLMNAEGGCVVCHGATSAVGSSKKVSADGNASENGGFANEDARHGKASSCADYECHATSPHGVGVSEYAAAKSAMLSDAVDPMIAAALQSGIDSAPVTAVINDDWTESMHFDQMEVDIYQPQLKGADATAITNPTTPAEVARGRAIVTGYTCANNGCHMNGSFNGVSADATFGNYRITIDGTEFGGSGPTTTTSGIDQLRTSSIKGHTLFTAASGDTAYAASGSCNACHDQTDVRRADAKAFPHSNAVWRVANGTDAQSIQDYGYTKTSQTAAWFKVSGSASVPSVNTNTRNISGTQPTAFSQQLTVGMDGACLKCHATGDNGSGEATGGVGIDF